jgi:hypothetical protein
MVTPPISISPTVKKIHNTKDIRKKKTPLINRWGLDY